MLKRLFWHAIIAWEENILKPARQFRWMVSHGRIHFNRRRVNHLMGDLMLRRRRIPLDEIAAMAASEWLHRTMLASEARPRLLITGVG